MAIGYSFVSAIGGYFGIVHAIVVRLIYWHIFVQHSYLFGSYMGNLEV
jgi:hypothetical protein